ncbi:taperin-like [Orcinus orca]|uniref:taperin-like n=1 Tax=Orcinus orca TaxID=9733 RepID=UPI002111FA11|nr:taperin-like [Orcinus orca]
MAHSEVSCAECGQVPGSFTAPPPGSRPPRPAPVRPADPSAPGRLRRRCRVSRSGSRSGIRRAGGAGRGRGPGAAALQPGPSAVPVRGDRAARAMPAGTPPAAGARCYPPLP